MALSDITKEKWLTTVFPEWGTWLNDEIEDTVVQQGTFAMWWLGCTGVWIKTAGGCNLSIDMWMARGKATRRGWPENGQGERNQINRMVGSTELQPNCRYAPVVLDPFEVKEIDAFMATHDHNDHMDMFSTAAIANKFPDIPFIGPEFSAKKWMGWGLPKERIIVVKPGDVVKVKDVEILVLDSFDKTALITDPTPEVQAGVCPDDMDRRAVNYLIKTSGGNIYHSGDSHFSNYYRKHGSQHRIDVALLSFGENPKGVSDKMTSVDILRAAENLECKVVIPIHYEIWQNILADPHEIDVLYEMRKDRLQYTFKPYIWHVGGKFVYPDDKDRRQHMFPRGYDNPFQYEPIVPFKSFL